MNSEENIVSSTHASYYTWRVVNMKIIILTICTPPNKGYSLN